MQDGKRTVLVTGVTGFLGSHVAAALARAGHSVRGTARTGTETDWVEKAVPGLAIVRCDLTSDDGWAAAMGGCDHVLHVASPFPDVQPKDPAVLVRPAVEGTRRVLEHARDAGVARIVVTGSMNCLAADRSKPPGHRYTEADWTDPDAPEITPYDRAKTLAELEVVRFGERNPDTETVTIHPGAIFGPLLGPRWSASGEIVRILLAGEVPAVPRIGFSPVDVRDVADAHVAAMDVPDIAGRRFICSLDHVWLADIARILADRYGGPDRRIPTRTLPDWLTRAGGLVKPALRRALPHVGRTRYVDTTVIRTALGWSPRPLETALADMADSFLNLDGSRRAA